MEQWADGDFTASLTTEMVARNAGATGAASAYKEIIDLEYDELLGESNE